jgi:hypothetical protein
MTKNRWGMAALLSAALSVFSPSANATLINFDFQTTNGNPFDIIGQLNIANVLDSVGGYDVLGISGTVFYLGGGPIVSMSISGLVNNPSQPNPTNNGSWIYDNVGFSGQPHLDINGVLFTAGPYTFNIYSNVAIGTYNDKVFIPNLYFLSSNDPNGNFNPGQTGNLIAQQVSGVPELSTWGMMLIGFAGIGFVAYRRAQKSSAAAAVA